jgi:hypothetical protein
MSRYQCRVRVFFVLILFVIVGGDNLLTNGEEEFEEGTISGFVQKGPFIKGSSLTIQDIDKSLSPTGKTYNTQILNHNGEFSIPVNTTDSLFEFIAQGFYFNEITNFDGLVKSNSGMSLLALLDSKY